MHRLLLGVSSAALALAAALPAAALALAAVMIWATAELALRFQDLR